MLKELIEVIRDTALKHKLVNSFKYQSSILVNAQNGNKYLQVVVDDTNLSQLLVSYSPDVFTVTLDVYVLGFVDTESTILNVQDIAYDTALQIMKKIETDDAYKGKIEIHDYSLLTLSHYTDDNSAGVKMSLEIRVPVGYCDLDEYFDEEAKDVQEEDKQINLIGDKSDDKEILLNPIKVERNPIKYEC